MTETYWRQPERPLGQDLLGTTEQVKGFSILGLADVEKIRSIVSEKQYKV